LGNNFSEKHAKIMFLNLLVEGSFVVMDDGTKVGTNVGTAVVVSTFPQAQKKNICK
jgi:cell shape-determining protein MreC